MVRPRMLAALIAAGLWVADDLARADAPAVRTLTAPTGEAEELEALRAENAMLRQEVQRLRKDLAALGSPPAEQEAAPQPPGKSDQLPEERTDSRAAPSAEQLPLPDEAETTRLRQVQFRVARGDGSLAEELATLRKDLATRLAHGAGKWTPEDVEARIKIDKRICAIVRTDPRSTWSPLIRLHGPVSAWAAAAPDRGELAVRLRLLERHVNDESYVSGWNPGYRRSIILHTASQWMIRRGDTYRTDWDRQQFLKWLASQGVRAVRPAADKSHR